MTISSGFISWHCEHGFVIPAICLCFIITGASVCCIFLRKTLIRYVEFQTILFHKSKQNDISTKALSSASTSLLSSVRQLYLRGAAMSSALPVGVLLKINTNTSSHCSGEDRREATILFCDIDADGTNYALLPFKKRVILHKWVRMMHEEFDFLRDEHKVQKVATEGSSYIAVSGLQTSESTDHAIAIANFAIACQTKFHTLGVSSSQHSDEKPLCAIRFGIHTGPTRGPFGDNITTQSFVIDNIDGAIMMQKSSLSGQIQLSKATANHINVLGLKHYIDRRTDGHLVFATYWLSLGGDERIQTDQTERISDMV